MAGAGDVKAGAAYIELSTKNMVSQGLDAASAKLKAFGYGVAAVGASVTAIGASITAPFLAGAKMFAESGRELSQMSTRTGIAVKVLSELGYVAKLTGTDMGMVEIGIRKMQKTIGDASVSGDKAGKALEALGLTARELEGLSPDKQFERIASAISEIEDPAKRTRAAMLIFGRTGTMLLPFIENMKELRAEATQAGLVMSEDSAKGALLLDIAMRRLETTTGKVFSALGAAVAPSLTKTYNLISKVLVGIRSWIKENQELVATIFYWGKVLTIAGAVLTAVGVTIVGFGFVLGSLSTIISAAVGAFGLLVTAIGFILSPIGLAIAAVTALGVALLYSSSTARSIASGLATTFAGIGKDATEAFAVIKDAILGGDISTAAKVLWSLLKTEFTVGWSALKVTAVDGINSLVGYWSVLSTAAAGTWIDIQSTADLAWASLETGASNAGQNILKAFIWIASGIADAFWAIIDKILPTIVSGIQKFASAAIELGALVGILSRDQAAAIQDSLDKFKEVGGKAGKEQRKKAKEFYEGQRIAADENIVKNNADLERRAVEIQQKNIEDRSELEKAAKPPPLLQDVAEAAKIEARNAREDYQKTLEEARLEERRSQAEREDTLDLAKMRGDPEKLAKEASAGLRAALVGTTAIGQFGGRGILAEIGGDKNGKATAENTAKMVEEQKKMNRLLEEQEGAGEFL